MKHFKLFITAVMLLIVCTIAYASFIPSSLTFDAPLSDLTKPVSTTDGVPLIINQQIEKYLIYYKTSARKWMRVILTRATLYSDIIRTVFKEEGLPEELTYLPIIESAYSASVTSYAGASGMWQFMPETGRYYGLSCNWWVDERRDLRKSTRAAAKFLKDLYRQFDDWYLALAAYNAGPGRVRRAMKETGSSDFWTIARTDDALPEQTKNYVAKYVAALIIVRHQKQYNFTNIVSVKPFEFDTITVSDATALSVIAACCETNIEALYDCNPELLQWATPPQYPDYEVKIPKGTREAFLKNYAAIPETNRITYREHIVQSGDSIWEMAKTYNVPQDEIILLNNIKDPRLVQLHQRLIIPIQGLDNAKKIDALLHDTAKNTPQP